MWRELNRVRAHGAACVLVTPWNAIRTTPLQGCFVHEATYTSEMAMKLSLTLIGIAGVVMLTAFASSTVSAQRANVPGALNQVPREMPRWTSSNVSTEQPFGAIDVAAAGSSVESVRLWTLGRSVSQRYEINGRCAVITMNPARFDPRDEQFCRNYAMAGFARPTPRS